MRVTYWKHSGFSISAEKLDILIDYIDGDYSRGEKPVLALVSHGHGDHRNMGELALIEPDRILDCPDVGLDLDVMGARIRTFGSTDEGVSFMIDIDGKRIFHAGDLNKWHWRGENDPEWTEKAISDFDNIMAALPDEPIDLAMFPVDPRMGEGYDEGACEFNERMKPGSFIPMHFWDHPEAAEKFAEKYDNVRALTACGQHAEI